jgi:multimeric flavodoxin WrbA
MNITVINSTEQKGSTLQMKEIFLEAMGDEHNITEYVLPRDFPAICIDCRICACESINDCPYSAYTVPLWENILATDLLVFTLPTFASDIPAQMEALLDHYYAKFMAHSPEANMSSKQAVVVTYETGLMMSKNTRSIKDSLDEWGVARTHAIQQAPFGMKWHYLFNKDKTSFQVQCERIASKIKRLFVKSELL